MSGENVWSGVFDAPKTEEKKTMNKYRELLERLLKEWAQKFEIGEDWRPRMITEHDGVESYPIKETTGGLLGAVWPEKKLLYINTKLNGEREWEDIIKHLLIHHKFPNLSHGVDFDKAFRKADGQFCNFQKRIFDEVLKTEIVVDCELPPNHVIQHRQTKGNTVYTF